MLQKIVCHEWIATQVVPRLSNYAHTRTTERQNLFGVAAVEESYRRITAKTAEQRAGLKEKDLDFFKVFYHLLTPEMRAEIQSISNGIKDTSGFASAELPRRGL